MTVFYIIRHGETEPNTRSACLGRSDVPLNENGRLQALRLCAELGGIRADAVYSSPLCRARDTIAPYITVRGDTELREEQRIIERDFGEWENMSFAQIESEDPERFALWQADFLDYAVPGGESSAQVQKRVDSAVSEIAESHDGGTVFLVTHLGAARHIISRCLGLAPEESWRFTLGNGEFAVIEYDHKKGTGVLRRLNS